MRWYLCQIGMKALRFREKDNQKAVARAARIAARISDDVGGGLKAVNATRRKNGKIVLGESIIPL